MKRIFGSALALSCLLASSVLTGCSHEEPLPDRSKKLYSQHDEELVIRDFFDDRRGGFFVDIGSYHWRDLSTTYFLEKHLGWSGIADDAQVGFTEGYRVNRPKTKFFSYAVTDSSGGTMKLYLAFGASSLDPNWHDRFEPGKPHRELKAVDVPTITLNDLLAQNNVSEIDFLSMDIEGGEPAALAGFDIEKYKPELVCIEVGPETSPKVAAYFEQHGYRKLEEKRDAVNWYFTPKAHG